MFDSFKPHGSADPKDERGCIWTFDESSPTDQGPNNAMSDMFRKNPYESLVREAVQNSLDASFLNKPVHVSFSWRKILVGSFPGLFGIRQHLLECKEYWHHNESAVEEYDDRVRFLDEHREEIFCLDVSDYNTTGMTYKKNDLSSGLYAFAYSLGNSSKPVGGAGGSFGYGKAAYSNVSRIGTILISTQTSADNNYFVGTSTLATHIHNKKKRFYIGYYSNGKDQPVDSRSKIPVGFAREEPGTTISIVGVNKNEGIESIIRALLLNFWFSIYDGKLTASVVMNPDGELDMGEESNTTFISRETLGELMDRYFPVLSDNIRGHANPRPYYEAVLKGGSDASHIVFEKELVNTGPARFYMFRNEDGRDRISYMRSPKMLVFNKPFSTNYGFYGVFFCEDRYNILRGAENPAHAEWDAKNSKNIERASETLAEISGFISECLASVFSRSNEQFLEVMGLDELLPTVPKDFDIFSEEKAKVGVPTGETENEGSSATSSPGAEETEVQEEGGHVLGDEDLNPDRSEEPEGDETAVVPEGSDDDEKTLPHPDLQSEPRPDPDLVPLKEDDDSQKERSSHVINVDYRCFARMMDNQMVHTLVIHCKRDIEVERMSLICVGEDMDTALPVSWSSLGNVSKNRLTNFTLHKGRNVINVLFSDSLRHAVKVEAYCYSTCLSHEK